MSRNLLPPGASRWPQQLPYPRPIQPSRLPVPNIQSFNFPSAQFAPSYLPPGSAPFQPFDYDPQPEVLYGPEVLGQTETPRSSQAGIAGDCGCGGRKLPVKVVAPVPSKGCGCGGTGYGGCGCGGYGADDSLLTDLAKTDDTGKQHLVLAFAVGVVVGTLFARRRS